MLYDSMFCCDPKAQRLNACSQVYKALRDYTKQDAARLHSSLCLYEPRMKRGKWDARNRNEWLSGSCFTVLSRQNQLTCKLSIQMSTSGENRNHKAISEVMYQTIDTIIQLIIMSYLRRSYCTDLQFKWKWGNYFNITQINHRTLKNTFFF